MTPQAAKKAGRVEVASSGQHVARRSRSDRAGRQCSRPCGDSFVQPLCSTAGRACHMQLDSLVRQPCWIRGLQRVVMLIAFAGVQDRFRQRRAGTGHLGRGGYAHLEAPGLVVDTRHTLVTAQGLRSMLGPSRAMFNQANACCDRGLTHTRTASRPVDGDTARSPGCK